MQFVLPDEGRFGDVAADLGRVLRDFTKKSTSSAALALPRFETRFGTELSDALKALGLTAPYEEGNLLALADDRRLVLDRAIHQTFLAMDEDGTEAAAATVLAVGFQRSAVASRSRDPGQAVPVPDLRPGNRRHAVPWSHPRPGDLND